jgi:membrane protease YdiL (CAAX protease family)
MKLPKTSTFWVILLLLTLVVPNFLPAPSKARRATRAPEAYLSDADFRRYKEAESDVRLAIDSTHKKKWLEEARKDYAALAEPKGEAKPQNEAAANMARRVRIVDFLLKKQSNKQGETLWQSLCPPKTPLSQAKATVQKMRLGFLEPVVLADIARAQGNPKEAERILARWESQGKTYSNRHFALILCQLLGLLVGGILLLTLLVLLIVRVPLRDLLPQEAITEATAEAIIEATETKETRAGLLVDGFLFYLCLYHVLGFATGYFLAPIAATLPSLLRLGIHFMLQFGTGIASIFYIKSRGISLESIGLHTKNFWQNMGVGVAGYCMTLPLVILLGLLTRKIFGEHSDATPNQMLPMIATTSLWQGRLLLFGMAGIGAPFFEELFFRGSLWTGLRKRFSFYLASILTTLVFAALHPMVDWLSIFGMGMVFACLREARQSLIPSIVAHCLQNSLTFLSLSLLFSQG